jgi:hypothetical protein
MCGAVFPQDALTVVVRTDDSLYAKALARMGVIMAFKGRLAIVQRLAKSSVTSDHATQRFGGTRLLALAAGQRFGDLHLVELPRLGSARGRAIHEGRLRIT